MDTSNPPQAIITPLIGGSFESDRIIRHFDYHLQECTANDLVARVLRDETSFREELDREFFNRYSLGEDAYEVGHHNKPLYPIEEFLEVMSAEPLSYSDYDPDRTRNGYLQIKRGFERCSWSAAVGAIGFLYAPLPVAIFPLAIGFTTFLSGLSQATKGSDKIDSYRILGRSARKADKDLVGVYRPHFNEQAVKELLMNR